MALLHDRLQAGRLLAGRLMAYAMRPDTLVLGLPPGGIPVGYQVARALGLPFDACPPRQLDVSGRCVILVDQGIATGDTMRAAIAQTRAAGAALVIAAAPLAAREACSGLSEAADDLVCLAMLDPFDANGCWYDELPRVEDDDVRQFLQAAAGAV